MVRIIPWSLPSIAGGSQGGYTPAPEPVSNDPYDFTNATYTRTPAYNSKSYTLKVKFSGIVVNSLVGVSSVSVVVKEAYSSSAQSDADTTGNTDDESRTLTEVQMMDPNVSIDVSHVTNSNRYWSIRSVAIIVYDGDGNILQTHSFTVDSEA